MELPEEFHSTDGEDYVLKLKKSLYGLKQAPMLWFGTLSKSLLDSGNYFAKCSYTLTLPPLIVSGVV